MKHILYAAIALILCAGCSETVPPKPPHYPMCPDDCCSEIRAANFLKGHTGGILAIAFSPDGEKIVTASNDKTARIWDAKSGKELHALKGHTEEVNSASFSPDGKKIVTASWDKTARIWDAESGEELKQFSDYDKPASYFHMNPLMMTLAGWEKPKSIRFASFSPDGKEIVVALNVTARVWDSESGEERLQLRGHIPRVLGKVARLASYSLTSAHFSPDGGKIVTTGLVDGIRAWDAESGKELDLGNTSGSSVLFASFSPDGKKIVAASGDNIYFWDAELGGWAVNVFSQHKYSLYENEKLDWARGRVNSVNYSPDGKKLVVATESKENIFRIVDAESGEELQKLEGHIDQVLYAAFSPDGKKVVTASQDKTARIWILE